MVEDYDYYLTYHALMVVAGRLIASRRPYIEPGEKSPDFALWYKRFDLSHCDRKWLADDRRPVPADTLVSRESFDQHWRWAVTSADFDQALFDSDGWFIAKSYAERKEYKRTIKISVHTSFVASQSSFALARYLQTSKNLSVFTHPDMGTDSPFAASGSFGVRGYLDQGYSPKGADKLDTKAAGIQFPLPRLAGWVSRLSGVPTELDIGDAFGGDNRVIDADIAAWSDRSHPQDSTFTSGWRLGVSPSVIKAVMDNLDMNVLAEVRIEKWDEESDRWLLMSGSDEQSVYLDDYVKFYVMCKDGEWRDYRGRTVARP
jgi:hypothetical protein